MRSPRDMTPQQHSSFSAGTGSRLCVYMCVRACMLIHIDTHRKRHTRLACARASVSACVHTCVRACVRALPLSPPPSLSSPFSLLPLLSPPQLLSSPPLSPPPSLSDTTRRERIPQSAHRTEGSSFREICSEQHGQCLSIGFSVKKCLVFSSL